MTTITFDTLSTARRLREKGFLQEQAEAIADEMRINSSVDISHLSTKEEVATFKSELKADMKVLESSIDAKIANAKFDTIKWIVGSVVGAATASTIAIITTIIKVMH